MDLIGLYIGQFALRGHSQRAKRDGNDGQDGNPGRDDADTHDRIPFRYGSRDAKRAISPPFELLLK